MKDSNRVTFLDLLPIILIGCALLAFMTCGALGVGAEDYTPSISIQQQIDELNSRVQYLETQLHERTLELKNKIELASPQKFYDRRN